MTVAGLLPYAAVSGYFRAVFPWGEFVGEIGAEIAIKSVADG